MEDMVLVHRVGDNPAYEIMVHREIKREALDLLGRFGTKIVEIQAIEHDPSFKPATFFQDDIHEFVFPKQKVGEPAESEHFFDPEGIERKVTHWNYDKNKVKGMLRLEAEDYRDQLRIDIYDTMEVGDSQLSRKLVKHLRSLVNQNR